MAIRLPSHKFRRSEGQIVAFLRVAREGRTTLPKIGEKLAKTLEGSDGWLVARKNAQCNRNPFGECLRVKFRDAKFQLHVRTRSEFETEHRDESVRNVATCPDALHRSVPDSLRDRDGQPKTCCTKQVVLPFSLERR